MSIKDGDIPETDEQVYKIIDKKPKVKLIGKDDNAFAIVGECKIAWKKAGKDGGTWKLIQNEMMSSDYDHLLQTAMKYFDVR